MKKEVKIIIAVVLSLWLFFMGFEIGSYNEKKKLNEMLSSTQPVITTAAPTVGDSTQPTDSPSIDSTQSTSAPDNSQGDTQTPVDPSTLSKDEIVNKVNQYMTQLKNEQNMQIYETDSVYINVVDCSVPSVVGTINSIINSITSGLDPEKTYVFTNGQAVNSDGETVSPTDVVPPTSNPFSLAVEGTASAKAEKQGDNIIYTVTLVSESTNIENQYPTYHGPTVGYLDIAEFDLPINVTKGDMNYPGATMAITVGANDKISYIDIKFPMNGEGGTKVLGQEGTASFEGALDRTMTITY